MATVWAGVEDVVVVVPWVVSCLGTLNQQRDEACLHGEQGQAQAQAQA